MYRIHSIQGTEPLVLFKEGAVRGLEALLAEPQQKIETVISDEEVIKYVPILTIFTKEVCMCVCVSHTSTWTILLTIRSL